MPTENDLHSIRSYTIYPVVVVVYSTRRIEYIIRSLHMIVSIRREPDIIIPVIPLPDSGTGTRVPVPEIIELGYSSSSSIS